MRTAECVAIAVGALLQATSAGAQQAAPKAHPDAWLIQAAVLAAPAPLRDGAEVRAVSGDAEPRVLRPGSNGIICLADLAEGEEFAAACYHESLEPFMARGRALRREGVDGARRDEVRWQEIEQGKLAMPAAAMVYNLRLASESFDPATLDPATGGRLHALYLPGATQATTGLSAQPGEGPWLMNPGTPSAHVMIMLPARR